MIIYHSERTTLGQDSEGSTDMSVEYLITSLNGTVLIIFLMTEY